jgi:SSS family solute:Na+ symporter
MTQLPNGITGITLASLLAVLMSSADTYLLLSVQTLQNDILNPLLPGLSEKRQLLFSRVCTLILGILAVVIALYIRQAYKALMFAWTFHAASIGIPAFAALFWKKATTRGIISSIVTGFSVSLVWRFMGTPFGLSASIPGALLSAIVLITVSKASYGKSRSEFFAGKEKLDSAMV